MKTVDQFIQELLEACNNDGSTLVYFDHSRKGYVEPVADNDGEDVIIMAGEE